MGSFQDENHELGFLGLAEISPLSRLDRTRPGGDDQDTERRFAVSLPDCAKSLGKKCSGQLVYLAMCLLHAARARLPKPSNDRLNSRKIGKIDMKQAVQLHKLAMVAV